MNVRGVEVRDINQATTFVFDQGDTWEPDTFDSIDAYVNGGVYLDIGAWVGIQAVYAAKKASRVIALEPDPVAYQELLFNVAQNRAKNVTAIPKACWSSPTVVLAAGDEGWGDSMTGPRRVGEQREFPAVTPAALLAEIGEVPDLVKIDIEGGESEVLGEFLTWGCPVHVSIHLPLLTGPLPETARPSILFGEPSDSFHTVLYP